MIIILFTAGNFGSTIEWCLRTFSKELAKVEFALLDDGSMHGYKKSLHPTTFDQWSGSNLLYDIATPVFPNKDFKNIPDSLEFYINQIPPKDPVIFVDCCSFDQAQRTQLFSFHKNKEMLDTIMHNKCQSWNQNYTDWRDMRIYELREALSFFVDQQLDHVNLRYHVPAHWLVTDPDSLLYRLPDEISSMIKYCGLTSNNIENLKLFYQKWFDKQQYILDEFHNINEIIDNLNANKFHSWSGLSLFGEAILQSKLRHNGYEIAVTNLDQFPQNTSDLSAKLISGTPSTGKP